MNCWHICLFCYNHHLSRCPLLSSLLSTCFKFLWNLWYLLAKFVIFLKIANCQHATFCRLICIFGQTLDEFLAHPNLVPRAFSSGDEVGHTRHFCWNCLYRLNLPFSYNRYLYKMPVFVVSFKSCQTWWIFPKIRWFRKKWHFRKNPQLTTSFFCHLVLIFAKPLINSCQIRHFRQNCYPR